MRLPWRLLHPATGGPAIETSLTAAEAAELRRLAVGKVVLEVGAAFGFSTVVLARAASLVVSVDHHNAHGSLEAFRRNLDAHRVSGKVVPILAGSQAALPLLAPGGMFDLAFVDGDHRASGVRYDATQALRLVRPGGVLAFHDYGEYTCPEVAPALDALFDGLPRRLVDTLLIITVPGRP